MSEVTSFRIAFFSDSSNNSYSDNKPDNFRVKLTHPIDLTVGGGFNRPSYGKFKKGYQIGV